MKKRFYFIPVSLFFCAVTYAQNDSFWTFHSQKRRASAYDTNAIYFNKWKLNFNADIGYMDIDPSIVGRNNTPGLYGTLNPDYRTIILPSFNFSASFGVTEKSALGAEFLFQQTNFTPVSSSPRLSPGNLPLLGLELRYLHCIHSWRHFYYGVQYGVNMFQGNYNPNTFIGSTIIVQSYVGNNIGWFFGVRLPIAKRLWVHYEIQEEVLLSRYATYPLINEGFGFNYCIDTRTPPHTPVKYEPVLVSDSLKRFYLRVEDSARARSKRLNLRWDSSIRPSRKYDTIGEKHTRSVYDSSSPYYNKGKWNLSIESGNSDMDIIALSMFGTINPNYNQRLLPLISVSADYGMRKKSDIGIDLAFQQVDYNPKTQGPDYPPGHTSVFLIEARYIHCIWSWQHFYYGFKAGTIIWGKSFSSNTFYNPPTGSQPLVQPDLGGFLGVRFTLVQNISVYGEIGVSGPLALVNYGLTYRIAYRKRERKAVSYY